MNAPRPKISPVALCPLAPLLIFGCVARTPLHPLGGSSPEESADAGDETGGAIGAAGAGGGGATGTAGRGGAGGTGGSVATAGGRGSGGVSGGTGGSGGAPSTSGTVSSGGRTSTVGGATTYSSGGRTTSGGTTSSVGGTTATRGGSSAGGASATGGSSRVGGSVATDGAAPPGTPTVTSGGYVTLDTGTVVMMGHVSSYESGSGSSITLSYGSNSFCASGTVAADSTYSSWAGAGFNVNQAQSGASGSSGSLALSGSSISVSYVNHASSTLELQLWDGSDYWCAYLPASTSPTTTTIPFSKLNTQCWDGLGSPFVSGTPITAVQLMVPGNAITPTPFDFCFLGLTVQ